MTKNITTIRTVLHAIASEITYPLSLIGSPEEAAADQAVAQPGRPRADRALGRAIFAARLPIIGQARQMREWLDYRAAQEQSPKQPRGDRSRCDQNQERGHPKPDTDCRVDHGSR